MSIRELPNPPTDAISSVRISPDGATLIIGAWDSCVHIYSKSEEGLKFANKIACDAPVLDVCWHPDSASFFAVGLDQDVVKYDVAQGAESRTLLSTHSKASTKIAYSKEYDILLSVSWDATMHVHDPATAKYISIKLAAKPFALSLTSTHAVVAMAERHVHVYDLSALRTTLEQAGSTANEQQPIDTQPWQQRISSLKFMTRGLASMPDGTGFASSSIEGRVGVEWFGEEENKQTYAFKCHRDKVTLNDTNGDGEVESKPVDIIYPVNAVAFHPIHGTFATGGGDGVIALWDAKTKRRVRQYPKLPSSVAALDFSADGKSLAMGISPGFEDGQEEAEPDPSLIKVFVRELGESEAMGKAAKDKAPKGEQ